MLDIGDGNRRGYGLVQQARVEIIYDRCSKRGRNNVASGSGWSKECDQSLRLVKTAGRRTWWEKPESRK